jgi:P4 family phage/plasmid primase-like protien
MVPRMSCVILCGGLGTRPAGVVGDRPKSLAPDPDVLMVLNYYAPYVSGLTESARHLAEELVRRGRRVAVVTARHRRSLPAFERINGVDVTRCTVLARVSKGTVSPSFPAVAARLARRARIVHLHTPMLEAGLIARLAGRSAADKITQITATTFDPDAGCRRWLAFLDRIFAGDVEMIAHVQRLFGYALTGKVSEDILAIFYGSGANGKSVLTNTMLNLLGDYGVTVPQSVVMESGHGDVHPENIATLRGRRLALCGETSRAKPLAEAQIKRLTGGDRLTTRGMYENSYEFDPTHTLIMASNDKPVVKGTDDAIWRRLKLVPFNVQIPVAERDLDLDDKLRLEWPGILAWAVRGCLQWQGGDGEGGLQEPEAVTAASEAYRSDSDVLGEFIAECCRLSGKVATTDL